MNKVFKKILSIILSISIVGVVSCGISIGTIRAGVFPNVQAMIVTSTITTLNHGYIAKIFASEKDIERIKNENRVEQTVENSDKSIIQIEKEPIINENKEIENSKTEEVKPIKDSVDLINIEGDGYKGHMFIVSNPKRIKLGVTSNLGKYGTKLNDIIKNNDAIGGVNAGGFADDGGVGNGGTPVGIIVKDGKTLWKDKTATKFSIVGFDKDGILTLGEYTEEKIKELNIQEAISFGPYLIVNGTPTPIYGNGGWGINPRTVIGQKEDGTVLMLVIDGRQASSVGITIKEAQRIMVEYGAVNAANLDGGSSTVMYYNNELINKPCSPYGERPLPTAFIITK